MSLQSIFYGLRKSRYLIALKLTPSVKIYNCLSLVYITLALLIPFISFRQVPYNVFFTKTVINIFLELIGSFIVSLID